MSKKNRAAAVGREGINESSGGAPPPEDPPAAVEDAGEVQPDEALPTLGGELSEEEIAKLQPGDMVDLGDLAVKPEDQADPEPAPLSDDVPRGTGKDPTEALKQVVLGTLGPETPVMGAMISVRPRPTKWRDAIALRVVGIKDGVVSIDLHLGDFNTVHDVPFGGGVRCWKFRGA